MGEKNVLEGDFVRFYSQKLYEQVAILDIKIEGGKRLALLRKSKIS